MSTILCILNPSEVSDEERAFIASYFTLMPEDALQSPHSLQDLFNGLSFIARPRL